MEYYEFIGRLYVVVEDLKMYSAQILAFCSYTLHLYGMYEQQVLGQIL